MTTLGFHAMAPGGMEGRVVEIARPTADGTVAVREWTSEAYLAPPAESVVPVSEMAERVRRWERAGWTFTEAPSRILYWLGVG